MTRPTLPTACGTLCLALLAGCVADHTVPQRSALWSSRASDSESKFGKHDQPSPKLNMAYGLLQEQMGNYADARKSYESVLGEDPRSVDAMLGLARLDQLAGKTEQAEMGFRKALRLRPRDPATLDAVGQFYASQKRWPEALQHLNHATQLDPEKRDYRFHLGVAMARAGDTEGAVPHLAKTVGQAEAHYNIGYVLYEKGDLAGAEKHFLTATLMQPGLAVAQQMLDEVRNSEGQPKVLPASATEKPKLEHSLPFPTAKAPQQRPVVEPQPAPRRTPLPAAPADEPPAWNNGQSSDRPAEVSRLRTTSAELPEWPRSGAAPAEEEVPFGATRENPFQSAPLNTGHSSDPEPYPPQFQQWQNQHR